MQQRSYVRTRIRLMGFLALLAAISWSSLAWQDPAQAGKARPLVPDARESQLAGLPYQSVVQTVPTSQRLESPRLWPVSRLWQCSVATAPGTECQTTTVLSHTHTLYLPIAGERFPWVSPLGIQSTARLSSPSLLKQALGLNIGWVRIGPISWRALQPTEGGPIQWSAAAAIDNELRAVARSGLIAEVIVADSPRWATINLPFPTACGAIRADKFAAFAQFLRVLVSRYKAPEFGIWNWELGNEPDVDPRLVPADSAFGCWGNSSDPYYGGRHYGEMLKVVAPAIRSANPFARIWIGGLLLNSPNTSDPNQGRPELFLKGILEAGAAPSFDVVPYHSYPPYLNRKVDPDNPPGAPWEDWGGMASGKARFLKQMLHSYGVEKPLILNETGFMCPESQPYARWCTPPSEAFYQMQSMYVIRAFSRSLAEGVQGMYWYTLNGPGWRYTGLLDANANPMPAYKTIQVFNAQIRNAEYLGPTDYGTGVEGYTFTKMGQQLRIIWAKEDQTLAITVPQSAFIQALDENGVPITPFVRGTEYLLVVKFEPIYLMLRPKSQ